MFCRAELRSRLSAPVKVEEHDALVYVRRSDCERVTEREELVGRLSFASRFPQYLSEQRISICVLYTRPVSLKRDSLYDGYVDWSCSTRSVNFSVCHVCLLSKGWPRRAGFVGEIAAPQSPVLAG